MKVALIAAHDPDLVIGYKGDLPWYYPEDLKFFKRTTMGHPILMGRKVFEELNEKPLPGRKNVVLSRSRTYDHVDTYSSIDKALNQMKNEGYEKIFIIGGGEIYRQTMNRADCLYITLIHESYKGDTHFPEYRKDIGTEWEETDREDRENLSFIKYRRKDTH